jgi:transcriptional regulator GlxA family with amidase domain
MVSVYAVLGPQAGVTTTGPHQVGIDFSGHVGLVREIDGRARRHDAPPGAVYVTGRGPAGELRPGAVDVVAEYIRAHLADVITLDNLAGAVSLSPYHFARSFRATTGMTPHAFVTEHRLMVARDRLLRGDASVTGIALSVGFSNISHFRRLFRRRYGLTPAGLRGVAR